MSRNPASLLLRESGLPVFYHVPGLRATRTDPPGGTIPGYQGGGIFFRPRRNDSYAGSPQVSVTRSLSQAVQIRRPWIEIPRTLPWRHNRQFFHKTTFATVITRYKLWPGNPAGNRGAADTAKRYGPD